MGGGPEGEVARLSGRGRCGQGQAGPGRVPFTKMAAIVVGMVKKRDQALASNDGLGGPAAQRAIKDNDARRRRNSQEHTASDAVNLLGAGKGPKWADVRKRLAEKGVDMEVSGEREKAINAMLAAPEYQPLFTRMQETIRQPSTLSSNRWTLNATDATIKPEDQRIHAER